MRLFKIIKYIFNHPLSQSNKLAAISRFFRWQIAANLNPYPIIYPFANGTKLMVTKGMAGATGNIYTGLHEFEDMSFLLHFLLPDDLFVDIGANVGTYTVLASGAKKTQTISIEPIPTTFQHLKNNVLVNDVEHLVTTLNIGLGGQTSTLKFTNTLDAANHIVAKHENGGIEVFVKKLDDVLGDKKPILLKIDVEGYETEVLKGALNTLKAKTLKAIIIELNGSGERYGFDESLIHQNLLAQDFIPYQYYPFERILKKAEHYGTHNTIYIRDIEFVQRRVKNAQLITVNHHQF